MTRSPTLLAPVSAVTAGECWELIPIGCCLTANNGTGTYTSINATSMSACTDACVAQAECYGIEYHTERSIGNCEIHTDDAVFHHTVGGPECGVCCQHRHVGVSTAHAQTSGPSTALSTSRLSTLPPEPTGISTTRSPIRGGQLLLDVELMTYVTFYLALACDTIPALQSDREIAVRSGMQNAGVNSSKVASVWFQCGSVVILSAFDTKDTLEAEYLEALIDARLVTVTLDGVSSVATSTPNGDPGPGTQTRGNSRSQSAAMPTALWFAVLTTVAVITVLLVATLIFAATRMLRSINGSDSTSSVVTDSDSETRRRDPSNRWGRDHSALSQTLSTLQSNATTQPQVAGPPMMGGESRSSSPDSTASDSQHRCMRSWQAYNSTAITSPQRTSYAARTEDAELSWDYTGSTKTHNLPESSA
jgi:hypothetical protein